MAAAIQRNGFTTAVQTITVIPAKDAAGSCTLRIETPVGAWDCPTTQAALLALAASITAVANS